MIFTAKWDKVQMIADRLGVKLELPEAVRLWLLKKALVVIRALSR